VTLPVQRALFDVLIAYAKGIESGAIRPTQSLAATSPALTFCENFYAQFFQNELREEIKGFNLENKRIAVRTRLALKARRRPTATVQLITWFEKLCDIYPNVLALAYGGGTRIGFHDFHMNYLITLLKRITTWARVRKYGSLERTSQTALRDLQRALKAVEW
jgi:hypothetical protein